MMRPTIILHSLLTLLRNLLLIGLYICLFDLTYLIGQQNYSLPYRYQGRESKAELTLGIFAEKSGTIKNISSATETKVDFTDTNTFNGRGDGRIRFSFSNLTFPHPSNSKKLRLSITASVPNGLRLYSSGSSFRLVDAKGNTNGRTVQELIYIATKNGKPSITIQWKLDDDNGVIYGRGSISRRLDIKIASSDNNVAGNNTSNTPDETSSEDSEDESSLTRSIVDYSKMQTQDEEELWAQIIERDEEDGYRLYLRKLEIEGNTFSGKYKDEAVQRIIELRDEKNWKLASDKNTVKAYRRYLSDYSDGKYVAEAKRRINSMTKSTVSTPSTPKAEPEPEDEDEKQWLIALEKDTEDAYSQYISLHPEGKHIDEALQKVEIIVRMDPPINGIQTQYNLNFSNIQYPLILESVQLQNHPEQLFLPSADEFIVETQSTEDKPFYDYSWEEGEMKLQIQSIGRRDAHVLMTLGTPDKYKFIFKDALERTRELVIDPDLAALEIDSIWGELKSEDTLFVKLDGGKPDYFIRLSHEEDQFSSYEKQLNKHPYYSDVWYLDKESLFEEKDFESGVFKVSLLDSRKLEEVSYDRSKIAVDGGYLLSGISLWWVLLPVWLVLIVWLVVKYRRKH